MPPGISGAILVESQCKISGRRLLALSSDAENRAECEPGVGPRLFYCAWRSRKEGRRSGGRRAGVEKNGRGRVPISASEGTVAGDSLAHLPLKNLSTRNHECLLATSASLPTASSPAAAARRPRIVGPTTRVPMRLGPPQPPRGKLRSR